MPTIHQRIKKARKKMGYTQEQIATALGTTPQAVQQWEKTNGTKPRQDKLEPLAKLLNVSAAWLISGEYAADNPATLNEPQQQYHSTMPFIPSIPLLDIYTAARRPIKANPVSSGANVATALPHSQYAFAIAIQNDDAYNPLEPISFRRGDILIIEPCLKPIDGDHVFACISAAEHLTIIAKYRIDPRTAEEKLHIYDTETAAPLSFPLPPGTFIIGTIIERKTRCIEPTLIKQRLQIAPPPPKI